MDSKFCNPFRTDFMVFYSFFLTHLELISSQIYCLILQPHRISTYLEQKISGICGTAKNIFWKNANFRTKKRICGTKKTNFWF